MTTYATRVPLQLIENPHMMSDAQRDGRRHSSRLADKEDVPLTNGIGHGYEPVKQSQKSMASGQPGKSAAKTKTGTKRKPAYDEECDGFPFTRTRAKKAKAEPKQPPIAEEPPPVQRQEQPPPKRSRKKSEDGAGATASQAPTKTGTRRSARHSGGSPEATDPPPLPVRKRRKERTSDEIKKPSESSHPDASQTQRKAEGEQDHIHPIEITFDSTKIALPFADTPIIRRNQEMRRGAASSSRRSSLGMRGRRASSLIDTGKSNALPHDEVETSEFYKHIESEGLSEPRRMKQLLTWCGTRALGEKPTLAGKDDNAVLAAREIQSQLLKDFSTKSSLSDWFSRDEGPPPPSPPKANPKNAANQAKIQELEQQLARLKTEREAWDTLLHPPPATPLPILSPMAPPPDPRTIDASLLPLPSQAALSSLLDPSSSLRDSTSQRLNAITSNLEFNIDTSTTNIHALSSYKDVAGRLADEALANCARVLEERDREGVRRAAAAAGGGEGEAEGDGNGEGAQRVVGMREVLRGLSRIVDER